MVRNEPGEPFARNSTRNRFSGSDGVVHEISLKVRLGKLPEAVEFENDLLANIESGLGYTLAALEPSVMARAARFEAAHADPFDRMIAAHAIEYGLPLLTRDSRIDIFGVQRLKERKGRGRSKINVPLWVTPLRTVR